MVLMSDLLVDLTGTDANNSQNLTLRGLIDMNGHDLIFTNGVYERKQVTIDPAADMSNGGRIINNSLSVVDVTEKKAFAGKLIANGRGTGSNQSTFTFTNGGFTNAVECEVNGVISNSNVRLGGGIHAGNASESDNNPGQRFTRNRITLNGGALTSITAGADHNINSGSVTLAADTTVNALLFSGSGTQNIGAGRTLTIAGGALFFKNNGVFLGGSGNPAAGSIDFAAAEGVVSVHANQTGTIGSVIAGSNGLSKVQSGTLILTGILRAAGC